MNNEITKHRYVRIDLYRYIEVPDDKLNLWLYGVVNLIYSILLWTTTYAICKSYFVEFMEVSSLLKKLLTYIWLIYIKEGLPTGQLIMHIYAKKYRKVNSYRLPLYKDITLYDTRHFLDNGSATRKSANAVKVCYIIQVALGIIIVLCMIFGNHTHLWLFQTLCNTFIYWFVIVTSNKKICRHYMNELFGI